MFPLFCLTVCWPCLDKILGLGVYTFGQLYTIIPLEFFNFDLEASIYIWLEYLERLSQSQIKIVVVVWVKNPNHKSNLGFVCVYCVIIL